MATWDETPETQHITTDSGSMDVTQVSSPAEHGAYQVTSSKPNPITTYNMGPVAPNGPAGVTLWQRIIGIQPDGVFGPATDAATKAWQSAHTIDPDGVVGPISWQAAGYTSGPLLQYIHSAPIAPPITPHVVPTVPIAPPLTVKPPPAQKPLLAGMSLTTWGLILGGLGVGYTLLAGPPGRKPQSR